MDGLSRSCIAPIWVYIRERCVQQLHRNTVKAKRGNGLSPILFPHVFIGDWVSLRSWWYEKVHKYICVLDRLNFNDVNKIPVDFRLDLQQNKMIHSYIFESSYTTCNQTAMTCLYYIFLPYVLTWLDSLNLHYGKVFLESIVAKKESRSLRESMFK